MSTLVFGVSIILKDKASPVVADETIGLYNINNANSEFHWIQNTVKYLSNWNATMLLKNGIGKFTREIDLRNGGNIASPGSCQIKINNTDKFKRLIEDKTIYLPGLKCIIWEFRNTTAVKRWEGECQAPISTATETIINIKRTYQSRISNIGTIINSDQFPEASTNTLGKMVPITFGKLVPEFDTSGTIIKTAIAEFIRTLDKEERNYYSDAFFTGSTYIETIQFPVESNPVAKVYDCALRSDAGDFKYWSIDNTYVLITDGTGVGQLRKVISFNTYDLTVNFLIEDYFETELVWTGDERSWVQFIKINRRYDSDNFPCLGFNDKNGNLLSSGAELYTHTEEDGYQQIASYGYKFDVASVHNNQLDIDPKLFDQGNIDTQNSFLILPVENFNKITDNTLENWGHTPFNKVVDGLFKTVAGSFTINDLNFGDMNLIIDKQRSTYSEIKLNAYMIFPSEINYAMAFKFNLPKLPKKFTFSQCYIGIKLFNSLPDAGIIYEMPIEIKFRKFKYGITEAISGLEILGWHEGVFDNITVENLPDFYYEDLINSSNKNFFVKDSASVDRSGYTLLDTGITTLEQYQSYIEGSINFIRDLQPRSNLGEWNDTIRIYELCLIFKQSSDIKSNLYTPFSGRIFNDDFDSRKISGSLMQSPIDIFEHVCRLENFTDIDKEQPIAGWGKQYATDSLPIKLSGDGSFDDSELNEVRALNVAGQIFDKNDAYTDELKRKICKQFHLANWIDTDGNECLRTLKMITPSPSDLVTLGSVTDRKTIKISDAPISSIYVEPFVKFDFDPASGENRSIINIFNSSASIFNGSFVQGLSGSIAEELWQLCHDNWLKCKVVNKPSSDYTELFLANGAESGSIAEFNLRNWLQLMTVKEIEFTGHYLDFGHWEECHRFVSQFPQQTDNIQHQCIAEEIEVNPNAPYDVKVKALLF